MKNSERQLMFAGLFLCLTWIPVFAQEKSVEEVKLAASAGELDKSAADLKGQRRVKHKIEDQFGVNGARVLGMRYKALGYGEISIILGLAQELHGGLKDENLYKIVALRQGPPVAGWGKIAKDLGLKLGPVVKKVQNIVAEVRKSERASKSAKEKKIKSEKKVKVEKAEKVAKQVRVETTEKEGMLTLARE